MIDGAFKYSDGVNFLDYVEANVEPLCVEYCSSVQCHIFANYLASLADK